MGTAEFALPSLSIILEHAHQIVAVVTTPDKPKGRGLIMQHSPVKDFALNRQLPLFQPQLLNDTDFVSRLHDLKPDLIVVVAFKILPKEIFLMPRFGSINLHASLLPKYRGAAPINWAIINGEKNTGVTTFFLKEKVDEGNVILQAKVNIGENETTRELYEKLADVGSETLLHTINLIEKGKAKSSPQDESRATKAPKIFRQDCKIDWTKSTAEVHNFIRGLSPNPGAFSYFRGKLLKVLRASRLIMHHKNFPGEILVKGGSFFVYTTDGLIEILELQKEGKQKMLALDFLNGTRIVSGEKFS